MTEKRFNELKEEFLKAPDTQISKEYRDRLDKIKYGDMDSLRAWIEEASASGKVSGFALNAIGFGLYNPQWEKQKKS